MYNLIHIPYKHVDKKINNKSWKLSRKNGVNSLFNRFRKKIEYTSHKRNAAIKRLNILLKENI